MAVERNLTGVERKLARDDIIVSKTDLKGRITYANRTFLDISAYHESEILGQPHNVIRHPHMPRTVFKLLWDTIQTGNEIFAYVVNRAKNGDHYWVFAQVTPTFGPTGDIVGYHSSRRAPGEGAVSAIQPLYRALLDEEARHASPKDGLAAGMDLLKKTIAARRGTYEDFIFSL
jgi:PAS domain S-box-containing protein